MSLRILSVCAVLLSAPFVQAEVPTKPVGPANPGFEDGLAHWTPTHSTVEQNMVEVLPEAAHSGAVGLRITDSGPSQAGSLTSDPIALHGANRVNLSYWGRIVSGKGAGVLLVFLDAAGAEVTAAKPAQFGVYHENGKVYNGSADVPAGATQVLVRLRTWSPAEVTVEFDDLEVTLD